ncbi:hypothetical protein HY623_03300 [Candidatus Uhrbacteria bacterium]|nr:hypothetical protein [Candidatus Uhrbacteria bacterium]
MGKTPFIFFSLLLALFFILSPVFAENPLQAGTTRTTILGNYVHGETTQFNWFTKGFGVDDVSDVAWPNTIARRIVNIVFSFLGIVTVIVIIYAGFLWITAGGEEEKAKQGRTLLFQAFIGLVIILSAYLVSYFTIDQLVKAIMK